MKFKSLLLSICIGLFAINQNAFAITINQTLDFNPTQSAPAYVATNGSQEGRLFRDGIASTCASVKPNPGEFSATDFRQFDQYRFVALTTGCVTVTLSNAGDDLMFVAVYNQEGIDVGETSLNYLADIGVGSSIGEPTRSFSFDVVSEQVFNIVVHEVNVGGGIGQPYTLDLDGVKLQPDFSITEVLDATPPASNVADDGITGFQTGRLYRNGISSSCQSPKTSPGVNPPSGSRQLDFYEFIPSTTGCAIFSLSHNSIGTGQIFMVAYDENGLNSFDVSENYLADSGSSAQNKTITMSMTVTAGVPFYLVLHEVDPGTNIGDNYTLNISNETVVHTIKINSKLGNNEAFNNPDWTSSTGLQVGRLNRLSPISNCTEPKVNPGLYTSAGDRLYDSYTFVPTGTGCVEVTLFSTAGNIFSTTYNGMSLNPTDPSLNYLADAGFSSVTDSPRTTYGFQVTAGVPFTVAVNEVDVGTESGSLYNLTLRGKALYSLQGDVIFEDNFEE